MFFVFISWTSTGTALLFGNRKIDCLVSQWTDWSEPYGFGTISRERVVLRYPQNGGEACPSELVQTNTTGTLSGPFTKLKLLGVCSLPFERNIQMYLISPFRLNLKICAYMFNKLLLKGCCIKDCKKIVSNLMGSILNKKPLHSLFVIYVSFMNKI